MKLWMSRDKDDWGWIELWKGKPVKDQGTYYANGESSSLWVKIRENDFNSLTGLPLPRKGSKKLVEVSISIKPKGTKQ